MNSLSQVNPFFHTDTSAASDSPPHNRENLLTSYVGGFRECLSTIYSLFVKPAREDKPDSDCIETNIQEDSQNLNIRQNADIHNNWEIPSENITELVYLGSGAQGIVHKGIVNGEMVAIKRVREKKEADIKHLRKLNHKNIVRFRGVCTATPEPCIIMEYCQYGPLFEFLHRSVPITPKQIIKWAQDIAHGMAYLHSHKIIHRDLKSPNVLISDGFVAKVSDFGTSREWNDVSTIMSFTGTVAWMAPEVIRHVPCTERVDVWSFGVLLWELLTQEIPYKNLESHSIMWGVGSNTIELPIPSTCPANIQLLLNQCWKQDAKHRPPFKIIAAHLEIVGEELCALDFEEFKRMQVLWRKDVQNSVENLFAKKSQEKETTAQRREDMKQARDVRLVYEKQLSRANELFMEVCAVRLQLEQREKQLDERENALSGCRCRVRKNLKYFRHQTSSSSDEWKASPALAENNRRRKKKQTAAVVNETIDMKTLKMAFVECCICDEESIKNNNISVVKVLKDTVVENNGNVVVKEAVRSDSSTDLASV